MNENYSANITASSKSTGTKVARAFLHLFTVGTALIGGLVSILGFAAVDCARRGLGSSVVATVFPTQRVLDKQWWLPSPWASEPS